MARHGPTSPDTAQHNLYLCRRAFDAVRDIAQRLVERLHAHAAAGGDPVIDIDGALQCESFDVIGRVGFGHDFRATADLGGPGAANCRTIKEGAGRLP